MIRPMYRHMKNIRYQGKTYIKEEFFSGRTTKRGGGKPPEPLKKKKKNVYMIFKKVIRTS